MEGRVFFEGRGLEQRVKAHIFAPLVFFSKETSENMYLIQLPLLGVVVVVVGGEGGKEQSQSIEQF